jgi:hypothetical protein
MRTCWRPPFSISSTAWKLGRKRASASRLKRLVSFIEALRLYARMHAGEPAKYKVERWDGKDSHVEEIVASASLVMIGHAAFHAAVEQYPRARG